MSRTILVLLAAMALLAAVGVGEVNAVGTAAGDTLGNGLFQTGDTIPQIAGVLTVGFVSPSLPSDTTYAGPAALVSQTVDTGYDLAALNAPADSNGARARDTASYGYGILNKSNATLTMDVSAIFEQIGGAADWGAGAYKVFDDVNNDGIWNDGDAEVTTVTLAADATDTVVVVVLVPTTAVDDDSSGAQFYVTDRAPRVGASVTGDLWENGGPIAGNDARDTQYDTVATRVVGPNVRVSKAQVLESGRARPGDTIVYAITFDNDGGDTANNVVLYDAIPMNATYVPNSADSAELDAAQGYVTQFEDTYSGFAFDDTGSTTAKAVRWTLTQPLGSNSGDDKTTVDFTVSSGFNDSGRVYFKVRIN